jgi:hypothetical protein
VGYEPRNICVLYFSVQRILKTPRKIHYFSVVYYRQPFKIKTTTDKLNTYQQ